MHGLPNVLVDQNGSNFARRAASRVGDARGSTIPTSDDALASEAFPPGVVSKKYGPHWLSWHVDFVADRDRTL